MSGNSIMKLMETYSKNVKRYDSIQKSLLNFDEEYKKKLDSAIEYYKRERVKLQNDLKGNILAEQEKDKKAKLGLLLSKFDKLESDIKKDLADNKSKYENDLRNIDTNAILNEVNSEFAKESELSKYVEGIDKCLNLNLTGNIENCVLSDITKKEFLDYKNFDNYINKINKDLDIYESVQDKQVLVVCNDLLGTYTESDVKSKSFIVLASLVLIGSLIYMPMYLTVLSVMAVLILASYVLTVLRTRSIRNAYRRYSVIEDSIAKSKQRIEQSYKDKLRDIKDSLFYDYNVKEKSLKEELSDVLIQRESESNNFVKNYSGKEIETRLKNELRVHLADIDNKISNEKTCFKQKESAKAKLINTRDSLVKSLNNDKDILSILDRGKSIESMLGRLFLDGIYLGFKSGINSIYPPIDFIRHDKYASFVFYDKSNKDVFPEDLAGTLYSNIMMAMDIGYGKVDYIDTKEAGVHVQEYMYNNNDFDGSKDKEADYPFKWIKDTSDYNKNLYEVLSTRVATIIGNKFRNIDDYNSNAVSKGAGTLFYKYVFYHIYDYNMLNEDLFKNIIKLTSKKDDSGNIRDKLGIMPVVMIPYSEFLENQSKDIDKGIMGMIKNVSDDNLFEMTPTNLTRLSINSIKDKVLKYQAEIEKKKKLK